MNYTEFRELLGSYLEESLDEEKRRVFRRHLRECAPCRERAMSEDPTLLFAAATETPASEVDVEGCAVAVVAQIRQQRLARSLSRRRRPWLAAAAAIVIMIVIFIQFPQTAAQEKKKQPKFALRPEVPQFLSFNSPRECPAAAQRASFL